MRMYGNRAFTDGRKLVNKYKRQHEKIDMKVLISIGHGKSAKGGYDSGALGGNYQEFKIEINK